MGYSSDNKVSPVKSSPTRSPVRTGAGAGGGDDNRDSGTGTFDYKNKKDPRNIVVQPVSYFWGAVLFPLVLFRGLMWVSGLCLTCFSYRFLAFSMGCVKFISRHTIGRCLGAERDFIQKWAAYDLFIFLVIKQITCAMMGISVEVKDLAGGDTRPYPWSSRLREAPFLVLAPHQCYFDSVALMLRCENCRFLSKKDPLDIAVLRFLLGPIFRDLNIALVDREDKNSKKTAIEVLVAHAKVWKDGDRPFCVFSEGTFGSGRDVLPFRRGAFVPGRPVQPVVIQYRNLVPELNLLGRLFNKGTKLRYRAVMAHYLQSPGSPDIKQYSDDKWFLHVFSRIGLKCRFTLLPVYHPSPEEIKDPLLYANNVQAVMDATFKKLESEWIGGPDTEEPYLLKDSE